MLQTRSILTPILEAAEIIARVAEMAESGGFAKTLKNTESAEAGQVTSLE